MSFYKKFKKKIINKEIKIGLAIILLISVFLRFINYQNRWGLAYDQARDAIVAHYAIFTHQIPLIGPFSASGPFVFGPYMYWIYMFVTFFQPTSIILLWVVQTGISALMPLVMYKIGKIIHNNKLGLLLALLTAISTAQIGQSTNLTYSTFVGFVSMFVFLFAIKSIRFNNDIYFFLTALFVGLAVNIHFQAVGLLFVLIILPFFCRFSIKKIFLLLIGFFITFIPLIIFDFISNHYQSRNLISFFLSGGNEMALPKRWLTYLGIYWPREFSLVIGGYPVIGYILGILLAIIAVYAVIYRKLSKIILFILSFFIINVVILRYFKGEVYSAFLVYLHPAILILTAWIILRIKKINPILMIILLLAIVTFTSVKNIKEIKNATNTTAIYATGYVKDLEKKFPNKKFAVYDYDYKSTARSVPTVLFLMKNNLLDDSGIKVGFATATNSAQLSEYDLPVITGVVGRHYFLFDISEYKNDELKDKGWHFVNPSEIYDSIEKWYPEE